MICYLMFGSLFNRGWSDAYVLRVNFRGSDQLFFYQNLLIMLFCILNVQHNLMILLAIKRLFLAIFA